MTQDEEFLELANELLEENGKLVVYRKVTRGAYDRATAKYASTTADTNIYAFFSSPNDKQLKDGLYVASNAIVFIAGNAIGEPSPLDLITDGSTVWQVMRHKFYSSGKQNALYELVVNR